MKSYTKQSWREAPDPKLATFLQIPCPKQVNQTTGKVCPAIQLSITSPRTRHGSEARLCQGISYLTCWDLLYNLLAKPPLSVKSAIVCVCWQLLLEAKDDDQSN